MSAPPAPADIRAARERAGLTQSAAAALLDLPQQHWQRWETGTHRLHPQLWRLWLHLAGLERIPFRGK